MNEDNLNVKKSGPKDKAIFLVGLFLILSSLTSLISILSYNSIDPGWGIVNGNIPKNYLGIFGSTLSSFIIREFGIFSGIFLSITFFLFGYKILKNRKLNLFFLKFLGIVILFLPCVVVSEIINQHVTNFYGDKFPIFNFQTKGYLLYEYMKNYFENNFQLSLLISSILINTLSVIVLLILFTFIIGFNI